MTLQRVVGSTTTTLWHILQELITLNQGGTAGSVVSSSNAAVEATITNPGNGAQIVLEFVEAHYGNLTASEDFVINTGASTLTPLVNPVFTLTKSLIGPANTNMTLTLPAGGIGVTGVINYVYSIRE